MNLKIAFLSNQESCSVVFLTVPNTDNKQIPLKMSGTLDILNRI